eukprot:gnl/TRDRNA2_/TRDRNA2_42414_c0_seq1.p2 gnl/TRDRNA2_/TRDRNA2_42414_c0~~gnl/TRDRNA2_/TRDRNA2_42414_c0_seq1.p2  ORF type:complete len:161 (+),score=30.66 gnl/TRDRNA2_/TRDRNA2_42414_c0_seq1:70-552(+)
MMTDSKLKQIVLCILLAGVVQAQLVADRGEKAQDSTVSGAQSPTKRLSDHGDMSDEAMARLMARAKKVDEERQRRANWPQEERQQRSANWRRQAAMAAAVRSAGRLADQAPMRRVDSLAQLFVVPSAMLTGLLAGMVVTFVVLRRRHGGSLAGQEPFVAF